MSEVASDVELVCRTLEGDFQAFGVLVQRYQNMVYGVIYAHLHNFHDAQDLAQDVLLKVYRSLLTYDIKRPFGAWLYTIAKRTALDWLRSQERAVKTEAIIEEIADTAPEPDTIAERHEAQRLLQKALDSLSDVNRETFCLYYVDGYSINEIGELLSTPTGTVKRRLHVSRKLLREEVMKMVEDTFERNKLTWKITQDMIDKVLGNYLELNRFHNLYCTVRDVLSVDIKKLTVKKFVLRPPSWILNSELNSAR